MDQICERFTLKCVGERSRRVIDGCSLENAKAESLCFTTHEKPWKQLESLNNTTVMLPENLSEEPLAAELAQSQELTLLFAGDPLGLFLEITAELRGLTNPAVDSPKSALLGEKAQFAESTEISRKAIIGDRVKIGERCRIHAGAVVGDDCVLGDDVVVYPNAVLYPRCQIGNRVIIHATAVLGADGFGFRFQHGQFVKNEHLGCVIVADDVEIGAGTTIDRGMIEPTQIGQGTKIDNQVMIAHNCQIGSHNVFASQVGLAGSITTGDYCRFAGQVGVADHVTIGNGCSLGAKAGVHRNIPDGETHIGYPAGPESEQRRIAMTMQKLPEMRQRLRQLEKELSQLQQATSPETEQKAA